VDDISFARDNPAGPSVEQHYVRCELSTNDDQDCRRSDPRAFIFKAECAPKEK